jgi:hypothetical protein
MRSDGSSVIEDPANVAARVRPCVRQDAPRETVLEVDAA